jgi:HigB_toxin, RelE-like toxic component of a toxin-antitoxin system
VTEHYRLVVKIDYAQRFVYVWDVLTHKAYDDIDFAQLIKMDLAEKKPAAPKKGTKT